MQRDTSQRRAIRRAFSEADRPLSFEEVWEAARRQVPRLGIATVYRTVRSLTEEGSVVAVELPGAPARYELSGKDHHHHFSCEKCGRVFELEGCPANLRRLLPPGFSMSHHEVILYGSCPQCQRSS